MTEGEEETKAILNMHCLVQDQAILTNIHTQVTVAFLFTFGFSELLQVIFPGISITHLSSTLGLPASCYCLCSTFRREI